MCEFGDKRGMLLKNQELPKGLHPYIWLNWIPHSLYMFNSSFVVPITGLSWKNYKTTFKDMPRWCVMCNVYCVCHLLLFRSFRFVLVPTIILKVLGVYLCLQKQQ